MGKPHKKKEIVPKSDVAAARTATDKASFLAEFMDTGSVSEAAELAGVHRNTHYLWLDSDAAYAKDFNAAVESRSKLKLEKMETEAFRRAHDGTEKPVYQQGMMVGTITQYSDVLLMFLMKAEAPDKYKDRLEHTGKDGEPLGLTERERAIRAAALFDAARKKRTRLLTDGSKEVGTESGAAN